MTDRDTLRRAISLHQSGKVSRARRIYERVLEDDPESVDALHFLGLLDYQQGKTRRGVERIARALELNPHYADAYNNLGNILKESGQLDDARRSYESALRCDPARVETHNNLGVLLRHLGEPLASLEHLERAIELAPDWGYAHFNLANTLVRLKRHEAEHHFRRAIELEPDLITTYSVLGNYLYSQGRPEESRAVYEGWLRLDPDSPIAAHMLAACSGGDIPPRASDGFVVQTFDRFAASFESQLENLAYRAPALIGEAVNERLGEPSAALRALDLGCGTGLCGPLLRAFARRLTGVDLSAKMLDKARARGCYDAVHRRELVAFLSASRGGFDLIVSADTLIYFGDLIPALQAAAVRLEPGGLLLFTLEQTASPDDDAYVLYPHGRYGHGSGYVAGALAAAGLTPLGLDPCILRKERGQPVHGWLVAAGPAR